MLSILSSMESLIGIILRTALKAIPTATTADAVASTAVRASTPQPQPQPRPYLAQPSTSLTQAPSEYTPDLV